MTFSHLESQPPHLALDLARLRRQDFDHNPANHELSGFVCADAHVVAPLRVVQNAREIRVDLWHCPLWFLLMCLSPALAASLWIWRRGDPLGIAVIVIACAGCAATFAVVVFMNRLIRTFGVFCILDRVNARLELPRLGVSLSRTRILRFVEFRGWRDTSPETAPNTEQVWSRELSAIVKNDDGSFSRYQVVIGEGWPVSRLGKRLAAFFGVELTLIEG